MGIQQRIDHYGHILAQAVEQQPKHLDGLTVEDFVIMGCSARARALPRWELREFFAPSHLDQE